MGGYMEYEIADSRLMYLHTACGAILGAMGITVDVYVGDKPGEVVIEICGLPPDVDREVIVRALNRNEVRPLTDLVTVKFT
jgi:phage-related baseplate assembly protein